MKQMLLFLLILGGINSLILLHELLIIWFYGFGVVCEPNKFLLDLEIIYMIIIIVFYFRYALKIYMEDLE